MVVWNQAALVCAGVVSALLIALKTTLIIACSAKDLTAIRIQLSDSRRRCTYLVQMVKSHTLISTS